MLKIITKLMKNLMYSLDGLKAAWANELAFRLEVLGVVLLGPIPFWVQHLSTTQQALMLATLLAPMVVELLNSAIEKLSDVVTTTPHEGIKQVKDMASGAVLVTLIILVLTWGLCLWPQ